MSSLRLKMRSRKKAKTMIKRWHIVGLGSTCVLQGGLMALQATTLLGAALGLAILVVAITIVWQVLK